jgi:hypothetical protein
MGKISEKKDLIFILAALFLLTGVLLIGAKADFFKQKIKNFSQKKNIPSQENSAASENYATSSENIAIFSPGSGEIIKGTIFSVKGYIKGGHFEVFLRIKDFESKEIWLEKSIKIGESDGNFEEKIDSAPHGGWAIIEASFLDSGEKIRFPIKISLSI